MVQTIEQISLSTNFPVGPVNVYLIFGEKLTLVDAGFKTEQVWNEFTRKLNEKDLSIHDIDQVLLTHHHDDHSGLLSWMIEMKSVPVYAHRYAQPFLKRDENYMRWSNEYLGKLYCEFGIPASVIEQIHAEGPNTLCDIELAGYLNEGDSIPGLPSWEVIETVGHSPDHLAFYSSDEQLLISGDHLMKDVPSGTYLEPPYPEQNREKLLVKYIENLHKCADFPVKKVFPGHGPVFNESKDTIYTQLEKIERRSNRLKKILREGPKSGFEIVLQLFPNNLQTMLGILVSETISLLELLQEKDEVVCENKLGLNHYRLR